MGTVNTGGPRVTDYEPTSRSLSPLRSRLAAGFLIVLLIAGTALVWIGLPIGGMWLAGTLTDNFGNHLPMAMALIVPSVIIGTIGLVWINSLYLRITKEREPAPDYLWKLQRSGPLQPILAVTFVVGLVALTVWFFFFAENPPRGVF